MKDYSPVLLFHVVIFIESNCPAYLFYIGAAFQSLMNNALMQSYKI